MSNEYVLLEAITTPDELLNSRWPGCSPDELSTLLSSNKIQAYRHIGSHNSPGDKQVHRCIKENKVHNSISVRLPYDWGRNENGLGLVLDVAEVELFEKERAHYLWETVDLEDIEVSLSLLEADSSINHSMLFSGALGKVKELSEALDLARAEIITLNEQVESLKENAQPKTVKASMTKLKGDIERWKTYLEEAVHLSCICHDKRKVRTRKELEALIKEEKLSLNGDALDAFRKAMPDTLVNKGGAPKQG